MSRSGARYALADNQPFAANRMLVADSSGQVSAFPAATDGQIVIGKTGAAPALGSILGTTNQVNVVYSGGNIVLSAPQNLHTGATPTFAGLTLTGALSGTGATFSAAVAVGSLTTTTTLGVGSSLTAASATISGVLSAAGLAATDYVSGKRGIFTNTTTGGFNAAVFFEAGAGNTPMVGATPLAAGAFPGNALVLWNPTTLGTIAFGTSGSSSGNWNLRFLIDSDGSVYSSGPLVAQAGFNVSGLSSFNGATTISGGLTISSNGLTVTGNGQISGTLTIGAATQVTSGDLTVANGGFSVFGQAAVSGTSARLLITNTTASGLNAYSRYNAGQANSVFVGMVGTTGASFQANYGVIWNAFQNGGLSFGISGTGSSGSWVEVLRINPVGQAVLVRNGDATNPALIFNGDVTGKSGLWYANGFSVLQGASASIQVKDDIYLITSSPGTVRVYDHTLVVGEGVTDLNDVELILYHSTKSRSVAVRLANIAGTMGMRIIGNTSTIWATITSSAGWANGSSSRTSKNTILPIDEARLGQLRQSLLATPLYSYQRNDEPGLAPELGWIAEEAPSWVRPADGSLTISYVRALGYLAALLKDAHVRIAALEAQLA